MMRTIKRYPNRKLYDLDRKRYVTLAHIAHMIQEGEDIQVIDHETGEDLTSVTLSQIIFEREKKRAGFLPTSILTNLVRTGGGPFDYLRRSLHTSVGVLRIIEDEIDQRIESLIAKGEMAQEEGERIRREIYEGVSAATKDMLPDFRIEAALERLNVPSSNEIKTLQEQVERLMQRVDELLAAMPDESPDESDVTDVKTDA
ncbi:MAG: hypothetical protein GXP37_00855 [Chloroflexi bacterium]|nr:hypothetical protein [Chloroflexota bacterium]